MIEEGWKVKGGTVEKVFRPSSRSFWTIVWMMMGVMTMVKIVVATGTVTASVIVATVAGGAVVGIVVVGCYTGWMLGSSRSATRLMMVLVIWVTVELVQDTVVIVSAGAIVIVIAEDTTIILLVAAVIVNASVDHWGSYMRGRIA